jgi:hypothetical protein
MIVESGWKGWNASAAPDGDRDKTVSRPLCLVRRDFEGRQWLVPAAALAIPPT